MGATFWALKTSGLAGDEGGGGVRGVGQGGGQGGVD